MQKNEAYITTFASIYETSIHTYEIIDESGASCEIYTESNLADGAVKVQRNVTGIPSYKNLDESQASYINTESNLANGTVKVQRNERGISSCGNLDESQASYIFMDSNLADGTLKVQGNEAGTPSYENLDKSQARYINTESNLANGTVKVQRNEIGIPSYENLDEPGMDSNLADGVEKTGSEVSLPWQLRKKSYVNDKIMQHARLTNTEANLITFN